MSRYYYKVDGRFFCDGNLTGFTNWLDDVVADNAKDAKRLARKFFKQEQERIRKREGYRRCFVDMKAERVAPYRGGGKPSEGWRGGEK